MGVRRGGKGGQLPPGSPMPPLKKTRTWSLCPVNAPSRQLWVHLLITQYVSLKSRRWKIRKVGGILPRFLKVVWQLPPNPSPHKRDSKQKCNLRGHYESPVKTDESLAVLEDLELI